MARRDLNNSPTVLDNTVDLSSENTKIAVADFAEGILRQNEEAKIAKNFSRAQLDLNALDYQYRIDYQGDPMGGISKYKEDRASIFKKYGSDISVLYKRTWQEKTMGLEEKFDAAQQGWALEQTRVNSITSVNETIENNFIQAGMDGRRYASSNAAEIESFLNYGISRTELEEFGAKNIGSETTKKLLKTYDEDYMKSFLSGVAETNPAKALSVLEKDTVRNSFADPAQYNAMKKSLISRQKRVETSFRTKEKASSIKAGNNASAISNMGYAERQQYYDKNNVSPEVREFYDEMSGYSERRAKITPEEKIEAANELYTIMAKLSQSDKVNVDDVEVLQNAVFKGMKKGAFSESEGFNYIDQIITPVTNDLEAQASEFKAGQDNIFQENLGLENVAEFIYGTLPLTERETSKSKVIEKQKLNTGYKVYLDELQSQAESRGRTIAELSTLTYAVRKAIHNKALTKTKQIILQEDVPALSGASEFPSSIINKDGNKVATGLSNGKATATVKAPALTPDSIATTIPEKFRFSDESVAEKYAIENKLPKGTRLLIGGKPAKWGG